MLLNVITTTKCDDTDYGMYTVVCLLLWCLLY